MTIIEFIGCPGSGKSTICKLLMEYLSDKGFSVGNIHRDEIRNGALSRKLLSAKSQLMPRTKSIRTAIDNYTKNISGYHGRGWERDLLNAAYKLEQSYVRNMDYALFDEGPTQYVSAMMHDIEIDDNIEPLLSEINKHIYSHKVIAFYIEADTKILLDRICKRDRSGDRFISDNKEEMRALIQLKEKNLRYLVSRLKYSSVYYIENKERSDAFLQVKNVFEHMEEV